MVVILLATAVVAVAAYTSRERLGPLHRDVNALRIPFAYSPNQEDLLVPLIRKFNQERHRSGGRVVEVEGESIPSGEAEAKIAARLYRPTIWSPASSLWGRLLNFQARRNWVADENPSFARTPLVIALWKPEAEALGWPDHPIGFDVILKLARSRRGWAAYGLPTFGRFKLGHTNPDFSTSGLSFVASAVLQRDRKARRTNGRRRQARRRAREGAADPTIDRPLRRYFRVFPRTTEGTRAGIRVSGRDGGGDATRLQPNAAKRLDAARRDLPSRRDIRLRQSAHRVASAVGERGAA